ncbi:MAG: flavodoxin family protein [Campylobacteraceae bacterium]
MSKKVLIISSSPRINGNSDLLCKEFERGAKEAGNETELIHFKDKKINYCTGCGSCFTKKECVQKDDMKEVLEKMLNADVIVLSTPVYFYSLCGQMKTLIDRTCPKYEQISDKEFYFILTAADTNIRAMQRTVEDFRGFLDCLNNPVEKKILYGVGVWNKGDIVNLPIMDEAYKTGKNL